MSDNAQQLFIIPYAGGSVAAFRRLTDRINSDIETITVEFAGRGTRAREAFAESFEALLKDAAEYICQRRNEAVPFSLMGYSMGSVMAYEMLAQNAVPGELKHLFIAAEVSPKDRALELRKVEFPTEEMILHRAKKLGGLDERMLENKRFFDAFVRPMVSDYTLFYQYRFKENPDKVKTNTTFFYCERDTALKDLQKWDELIDGRFDFHEFGENHFFINRYYEEMAGIINNHLT